MVRESANSRPAYARRKPAAHGALVYALVPVCALIALAIVALLPA